MTILVKPAGMVHQHMLSGNPATLDMKQNYFDALEGHGQILVYARKRIIVPEGKHVYIIGAVQVDRGAGKGGGTHTEVSLIADSWKVDR